MWGYDIQLDVRFDKILEIWIVQFTEKDNRKSEIEQGMLSGEQVLEKIMQDIPLKH